MADEPTAEELAAQIIGAEVKPDHPADPAAAPEPEPGIDFGERAAAFESEWSKDHPPTTKAEPSGEPGEKPPTQAAPGDLLEKVLQEKYKGDRDLMASSLYEQWNSSARMHEELQGLKTEIQSLKTGQQTTTDELQVRLKQDPEVQTIDTQLESLNKRTTAISARQDKIIVKANTLEVEIAELKGQLKYADEDSKTAIDANLRNKQGELSALTVEFQTNTSTLENAPLRKMDLERQRKQIERSLKSELDSAKQDALEQQQAVVEATGELVQAVENEIPKWGIEKGSSQHQVVYDMVRLKLGEVSRSIAAKDGPDAPALDIKKAVEVVMGAIAKSFNLTPSKTFAQTSREKLATSTPRQPAQRQTIAQPAQRASVLPKGNPQEQGQFARERAKAILG